MQTSDNKILLVKSLKKGDVLAFDTIYKLYSQKLYGFVLKYIKDKEDGKEIVQEVFIKIWEVRDKIDLYSSFESFLFTIAYNTTINLLRKKANETKYLNYLKSIQNFESINTIATEIQFNELNSQVQNILNGLTPRQREIFKLSRENGLSLDEIAEKLEISPNTVKNHLVKTLAILRSKIDSSLVVNLFFIICFYKQQ